MDTRAKRTETLRAARERLRLSVSETARRAGVARITVWRLETGRRRPTYDTVQALEKALATRLRFPKSKAA